MFYNLVLYHFVFYYFSSFQHMIDYILICIIFVIFRIVICSSVMFRFFFTIFIFCDLEISFLNIFTFFLSRLERLYFQKFLWEMNKYLFECFPFSLAKSSWVYLYLASYVSFLLSLIFFFYISAARESVWFKILCNSQHEMKFHPINVLPSFFFLDNSFGQISSDGRRFEVGWWTHNAIYW